MTHGGKAQASGVGAETDAETKRGVRAYEVNDGLPAWQMEAQAKDDNVWKHFNHYVASVVK